MICKPFICSLGIKLALKIDAVTVFITTQTKGNVNKLRDNKSLTATHAYLVCIETVKYCFQEVLMVLSAYLKKIKLDMQIN